MRLRQIEIFHAIYSTGSITNAAKMLHVSQPSVSKVLAHAELQLGFPLFSRVKGRLYPTQEAKVLFGEADKIYQQIHSLKNTVTNINKDGHGTIKLGLTPALGFELLPEVVSQFHQKFPEVNFDLETIHNNAVMQTLLERKCDLAVLFSPPSQPGIAAIELAQSEMVIVYPKSTINTEPKHLSLSDLAGLELINIKDSGPLGNLVWHRLQEQETVLNYKINVQTYFIAARLVAKGCGFCIVDKFTAEGNLVENTAIASFEDPLYFHLSMLHLENRPPSKLESEFIDTLVTVLNHP